MVCPANSPFLCQECYSGYQVAGNSQSCVILCSGDFVFDGKNCVCPEGFYSNSNTCVACRDSNCLSCSALVCSSCKAGYALTNLGTCSQCMTNCLSCTSMSACTECEIGYGFINGTCMILTSPSSSTSCTDGCSLCRMISDVIVC